jgi:hypothetical protein
MEWYAYCISEKEAFPELIHHRKPIPMESVCGISDNQVFLYPTSSLAVIVSEHNSQEAFSQKSGIDHARVVADCFRRSTVLPFRFGTIFSDDEDLRRSIRCNQRQFLLNIEKLRGKAEMHLKISVDDCGGQATGKCLSADGVGRQYLTNLRESAGRQRERQTRARTVSFQMRRLFAPLEEEVSCRLTEGGKIILEIAHLIDRRYVERYINKFSATSTVMRGCQMKLFGPWPPYHFVQGLTRGVHPCPQQAVTMPVPAVVPAAATLVGHIPAPAPTLA